MPTETQPIDVRTLTPAEYEAAKRAVFKRIAHDLPRHGEQRSQQQAAPKPGEPHQKKATDMTAEEYAAARRAAIRGR